jgi:hypothetical protein
MEYLSLQFHLSTNILLASKQISVEAKRVLLEENDFIVLKVTGLKVVLEDIPAFGLPARVRPMRPVLHIKVENITKSFQRDVPDPITLITTVDGLQSIIAAFWRLHKVGDYSNESFATNATIFSSDLIVSLSFNVEAPARCEELRNTVLKPWESLHGIRRLTLKGDMGDSLRQHLKKTMLLGPFPSDVAFTLTKHYSMGEKYMRQKKYRDAQWW